MTIDAFQEALFEDPIGLRFRNTREKLRRSLESVAQELKLPTAVLDAIEREDWDRLGAPIFVRSYVGSYAKALGLPGTLADEVVRGKPAPQLTTIGGGSTTRPAMDNWLMNLGYLAMTLILVGSVVMLAMYFQGPKRGAVVLPLDEPALYSSASGQGAASPASSEDFAGATLPGSPAATEVADSDIDSSTVTMENQVMASMAPSLGVVLPTPPAELVMHFRGESWVDLVDRSGIHVERGLVPAGAERSYSARQLAQVTLGNALAVDVRLNGGSIDLTTMSDANVARFTVSSDGKIDAMPAN